MKQPAPILLAEDGHEEAVRFLEEVFPGSAGAPFLDTRLREWKYDHPHPFWEGTRCFVFRDDAGLTAHGGVIPIRYQAAGDSISAFQMIDWAGARRSAGAGLLLYRALWPRTDIYLAVGGSPDAVRVLTRIPGLRRMAPMLRFATPLRPWGQWRLSRAGWTAPARWLRAWRWRLGRPRLDQSAWTAEPLERLSEADAPLLVPHTGNLYTPLARTPALVNYWLACPAGQIRAWRLLHGGEPAAILVLAFLRGETRIVDLTLAKAEAPLAEAYAVAIGIASRNPGSHELAGASSVPAVAEAMRQAGMIPRGESIVLAGDPHQRLSGNHPIEVNLTVGDGFYLQSKEIYFQTFGSGSSVS